MMVGHICNTNQNDQYAGLDFAGIDAFLRLKQQRPSPTTIDKLAVIDREFRSIAVEASRRHGHNHG